MVGVRRWLVEQRIHDIVPQIQFPDLFLDDGIGRNVLEGGMDDVEVPEGPVPGIPEHFVQLFDVEDVETFDLCGANGAGFGTSTGMDDVRGRAYCFRVVEYLPERQPETHHQQNRMNQKHRLKMIAKYY